LDIDAFLDLPVDEIAALVRGAGPKVCVFPINGTRRWYMLEYPVEQPGPDLLWDYLAVIERRHIELYQLLFDHGIDYLLTPVFGPDLAERGDDYVEMISTGLEHFATDDKFLDFFRDYDVRVRFYGDYRKFFAPTPYAYLIDLFDELTARTLANSRHRLFFGLFAQDASESIAELSIRYHAEHRQVPDKGTLVELYYGEPVPPVSFFIGFDRFSAFDMPLVAVGEEDLYFTVSPSPYLSARQLREILYDHMFTRRGDAEYLTLRPDEWKLMREFYQANLGKTLGVGARQPRGGYWYPCPQVELPPGFAGPSHDR
jgi:tuberculosinol/isotuberculosinol synthase